MKKYLIFIVSIFLLFSCNSSINEKQSDNLDYEKEIVKIVNDEKIEEKNKESLNTWVIINMKEEENVFTWSIDSNKNELIVEEQILVEEDNEIEEDNKIIENEEQLEDEFVLYESNKLGLKFKYPKNSTKIKLNISEDSSNIYIVKENSEYNNGLTITVANTENEKELDDFIKKQLWKTCTALNKEESLINSIYNIKVWPEDKEDEYSRRECFLNFMYILKYSPSFSRTVHMNVGQDCNLYDSELGCFDHVIGDSFEFIEKK